MRVSFKRGSIVVLIYIKHTKALHLKLLPYTCDTFPHAREIRSGGTCDDNMVSKCHSPLSLQAGNTAFLWVLAGGGAP